jgi:DNA-binding NarL/FixJ family response regulator
VGSSVRSLTLTQPTVVSAGLTALVNSQRPGLDVEPIARDDEPAGFVRYYRIVEPDSGRWSAVVVREDDVGAIAETLDEGASAIITLCSSVMDFHLAIGALEGGLSPYLTASVSRALAKGVLGERSAQTPVEIAARPPMPKLTPRESDVLALLARGYTNREIAETLVVSINTIRTHIHSLGTKLNGSNRARIVANAVAAGWAEPDKLPGEARRRSS